MLWHCKDFKIDLSHARVMGIVNVTPDSFADGVRCLRTEAAVNHGLVGWILQFGDKIEVTEPETLREMVRDTARGILETYTRK